MTQSTTQVRAVRIGEVQALEPGSVDRLVAVGLGSCLGVAVIDERSGACAMAHVFLPECPATGPKAGAGDGTYADRAIPALVERVMRAAAGARRSKLFAVVAGGSQMFGARPGNEVGTRNIEAVHAALQRAGIELRAHDVGGSRGRTMRVVGVHVGPPSVEVRVVGSEARVLWSAGANEDAMQQLAA